MAKNLFQKKRLNPNDHKREEKVAKGIRNGFIFASIAGVVVKEGPKLVKKVVKMITKA